MKMLRSCLIFSVLVATLFWTPPSGVQAQEQIVHVVELGQNLFRIALRYGTTVNAIMIANGITDAHTIYAGQRLIIPQSAAVSPPADGLVTTGGVYVVQPGDTLTRIALRHGVTIGALMRANSLNSPHLIYVGQRLVIPGAGEATVAGGTYVVRPGDTLIKIARQFGADPLTLARLNGIANPSAIFPGQVLRLSGQTPAVPPTGDKRIMVDLSQQHLYAYQGEQLIFSFVASSGATPSYTRRGEFYVQSKLPTAYASAWDMWMPYWMGIYWAGPTENGIHALPILSNGQTLWASYLGQPVSYGCIVLGTFEAELLYNWAEIGTPVTVR